MAAPLTLHPIIPPPSLQNPLSKTTNTSKSSPIKTHPSLLHLENCNSMSQLKQIHGHMIRTGLFSNVYAASRIVAFCALEDTGSLPYARIVFDQIPSPTKFIYNTIIRGYTNRDLPREAVLFYREVMEGGLSPDNFTFPSLFQACADLDEGKQLHCHVVKFGFASDVYVQNTLMNMYSNRGCLTSAKRVFDKMSERTVVSWATMIAAYTNWDRSSEALSLFHRMQFGNVRPNEVTLVNVLTACARARNLDMAKKIHEYMMENQMGFHLVVVTALVDAYCKTGCMFLARKLFDEMPERNLFSWNIMIKGYVEDSDYKEALVFFQEMQGNGVKPDKVTMTSLLLACSHLGAVELGKWLHAYINKENIEVDVALGTALVDMYAKCGCIESASRVFYEMPQRDVMSWTSMIGGLAMCGHAEKALELFSEMQSSGVKPDAVTFVGILAACSHAGLVDKGCSYFRSMSCVYNIEPTIEHYGCVVDLLGRAGQIERAEEFIKRMPMKPDYFVLGGLLGACRIHGNLEVAERAARKLLDLDPTNGGAYVLLSNIYGSVQKWDEVKRTRELMAERNIKKPPGCSLIEVDGIVHEFVMGDKSQPQSDEIYLMLEDLIHRLKVAGYVPNKSEVLIDMDEEEKENALCRHSEKLAISYGLISTCPGSTLRVVKNLRVCSDCHFAMKLISKVYNREIIVRDRNRFHHFKDGSCSCRDFW
ncbi:pentatricopeptide repeat-containing protein, chloroplastic-like protein [Cinnamomum micranthum f. kanehirae]|uniref:Pentatricopeptide repeat-containing protein, chloroplastic-like protein n=1 Tax=Cinnamomum micranthum f. kanehirae TaxID=337451 RepID=A0A443N413_9MAGN|nr:pentatricopeptide repeat-containing protein, chloroplastic-like protein [Cinnamomum micranthum f. kanehirae]